MVRDRGWAVRGDTSVAGCYGSARGLTELLVALRKMLSTIDAWLAPKTGVLTPRANGDEEDADAMKLLAGLATNEPEPPSKAAPHGPTPPRQKKVKSALSKQLDAAVPMNVDSAPGAASRERRKSVESLPESPSTTPGIVRSDSRRLRSASHS